MILFLLNNLKTIEGMLLTAVMAFLLHSLDVNRIEKRAQRDLEAQEKKSAELCKQEKAITEEISNDYQKKLSALDARYNSLRRVQSSRCVTLSTSKPAAGCNAAPEGGVVSGQDGVASIALLELARDAEQVRLQLLECQNFVVKVQALAKEGN